MDFDRVTMDLLRPAAEGLRRALRRLEEEDVPAGLRALADSSARRLPPPYLKRALVELDGSEWLRAETAAEGGLEPGSAADAFIQRPEDWKARLAEERERAAREVDEQDRSELENRLEEARARISELEEELRTGAGDVAAAERRVRDRLKEQIEAAERARRSAEGRARDEARTGAQMASRAQRLEAELDAAEERLEMLRQLLEKERRAPAPVETGTAGRGWLPADPKELAEELDRIFAASRRAPRPGVAPVPARAAIRLPEGIRPDRIEVIHWLMQHQLRWLIDGYNVAFQVADEPDAAIRGRLAAAAARLAALAAPGSMVVVVFDSSLDTSSLPANRRVRIVYVHSADDWIIEHAAPNTVVVSSDRRVREESEAQGAVGVWSEALGAWIEAGHPLGG